MEKNEVLPYGTVDDLFTLISALRTKNNDEEAAKEEANLSQRKYSATKTSLKILDLLSEEDCSFTDKGRELAFSVNEEEKKDILLNIVVNYKPYIELLKFIFSKEEVKETSSDIIISFWGKKGFGNSESNRDEASRFFMNLLDYINLGKYIVGRGGKPSRIEWSDNTKSIVLKNVKPEVKNEKEKNNKTETIEVEKKKIETQNIKTDKKNEEKVIVKPDEKNINLTINVDMSSWSNEKIKIFFKYVYGMFDEEK